MSKGRQATLSAVLAVVIGAANGLWLDSIGLIEPAQAQTADERRKREQEKHKAAPPRQQQPPPRATLPPPQPPPKVPLQKQLPPPEKPVQQFQRQEQIKKPTQQFQQPPTTKPYPPTKPAATPPPEPKKEGIRGLPPPSRQGTVPPPSTFQKAPPATAKPPSASPGPLTVTPAPQQGPIGPQRFAPKRLDDLKKFRVERIEEGGRRKVIQESGNRFIVKEHNRTIVRHDEAERFLRRPGARSDRRPDGTVETYYIGRDGVRIVTVVDANGRLLRRYRRDRDGRERNIIDNRRFYRNLALGIGLGIVVLNLPPPRITIPYDEYIVDYDSASDDDLYETLMAPPIEDLDRPYSLEEIRDNYELRARVRSIDIDTIEFESGAWEVSPDQYDKLERIARAILRVLESNPEAVFLIAGFTDAVGSEDDNASLSDRRVASVAEVLTEQFDVPAENLVTQGYGEQYLKIDTQGPEPRNRRVSVLNVTGLMAER
jgi:outer membrane protein OmpA-like peptidoglycan-associated protein